MDPVLIEDQIEVIEKREETEEIVVKEIVGQAVSKDAMKEVTTSKAEDLIERERTIVVEKKEEVLLAHDRVVSSNGLEKTQAKENRNTVGTEIKNQNSTNGHLRNLIEKVMDSRKEDPKALKKKETILNVRARDHGHLRCGHVRGLLDECHRHAPRAYRHALLQHAHDHANDHVERGFGMIPKRKMQFQTLRLATIW